MRATKPINFLSGHMFGYACDETPELMPLTHSLATRLGWQLTKVRKDGTCPWVRPDGKTQVTAEFMSLSYRVSLSRGISISGSSFHNNEFSLQIPNNRFICSATATTRTRTTRSSRARIATRGPAGQRYNLSVVFIFLPGYMFYLFFFFHSYQYQ